MYTFVYVYAMCMPWVCVVYLHLIFSITFYERIKFFSLWISVDSTYFTGKIYIPANGHIFHFKSTVASYFVVVEHGSNIFVFREFRLINNRNWKQKREKKLSDPKSEILECVLLKWVDSGTRIHAIIHIYMCSAQLLHSWQTLNVNLFKYTLNVISNDIHKYMIENDVNTYTADANYYWNGLIFFHTIWNWKSFTVCECVCVCMCKDTILRWNVRY